MKIIAKKVLKNIKGGCPPDPRCPDYVDYCNCISSYGVVAPDCSPQF